MPLNLEELARVEKLALPRGNMSAELAGDGAWEISFPPTHKMRGPVSSTMVGYVDQSLVYKMVAAWNALPELIHRIEELERVADVAAEFFNDFVHGKTCTPGALQRVLKDAGYLKDTPDQGFADSHKEKGDD